MNKNAQTEQEKPAGVGASAVNGVVIQRFKAALTTGNWPDNPEPLIRDALGDYVKISDVADLIEKAHMAGQWREGDGVDPSYSDALNYRKKTLAV
jgi:hypothetical protein